MRLVPGNTVPDLVATDFLGNLVDLKKRRRPVLLSFYRYASCPVCNLRMQELIRSHPRLTAAGLDLIAVFQSPAEVVACYVGRQDAPFPIVPDHELVLYRRFGVEANWGGLFTGSVLRAAKTAIGSGFKPGRIDGPLSRLPADLLIGADGRVAIAYYGKDINDHLPLPDIEHWLQSASLIGGSL